MTNKKNILFDLGGVLIHLRSDQDWLDNFMIPLLGEVGAIQHQLFDQFEVGQFTLNEFYKELHKLSDNNFTQQELVDAWNNKLLDFPIERIEFLLELTSKFDLWLLSNTNEVHLDFIFKDLATRFGRPIFEDIFSKCYYSHILKIAKPSRSIYEQVLADTNLQAAQLIFIDDNAINLEEPQAIGMPTIHFKNDDQLKEELNHWLASSI